jgi:hypothetical protein
MTLHAAPGDGFFGTQRTVLWIFHRMNLYVALSVVCGCMIFVIYILSNNLITMNNMSLWYIFHVKFYFTFFTLFLVLRVFCVINLTAIIKMVISELVTRMFIPLHILCKPLIRRVCFVTLVTITADAPQPQ